MLAKSGFLLVVCALLASGTPASAQFNCTGLTGIDETATSGDTSYEANANAYGVDAGTGGSRVVWTTKYRTNPETVAIDANGHTNMCFHGGKVIGVYGNDVTAAGRTADQNTYFECSSEHGCGTGCSECASDPPSFPCCMGFHEPSRSKEAWNMDVDTSDSSTYLFSQNVSWNVADGYSLNNDRTHNMDIRDAYLADVHDDAFESDSKGSIIVRDSLVERAFMGLANDGPGSGSGEVAEIHTSMIELFRFVHRYKETTKTGHGGFWKLSPTDAVKYKMVANYFLAGLSADGEAMEPSQIMVPAVNRTVECSGDNWLLWAGTVAQWNAMADGRPHGTGSGQLCDNSSCRTTVSAPSPCADGNCTFSKNGERLAYFDHLSDCMTIFFKGDSDQNCAIEGADDGLGNGHVVNANCIDSPGMSLHTFLDTETGWFGARDYWCTAHGTTGNGTTDVCRFYQHLLE